MIQFTAIIKQFAEQGEKTGWTYIEIPEEAALQLKPGGKTSFRVKGRLDYVAIAQQALIPMGGGKFILVLNAALRKSVKKMKGASINVSIAKDETPLLVNSEFLECLQDEPRAAAYFARLTQSHQLYFSKWIESAKADATKAKRIAMAVNALARGWGYPEMLRAAKADKQ